MRAVLLTMGSSYPGVDRGEPFVCRELFPLVDRPFIQHVVECLLAGGIEQIEFILHHQPEKFRQLLGDGDRWGGTFRYHLAKDPEDTYRSVKILASEEEDEPLLIGHVCWLPGQSPLSETGRQRS